MQSNYAVTSRAGDVDPGAQLVEELLAHRRTEKARWQPMSFDLEDMAILSLNAYTRALDENSDYLLWMAAWYDRRPLAQRHTHSDGNQMPKYAEGIALMRLMTGSTMNREIDAKIWKWIDDRTGEDGLIYKQPGQADAYGNGRALLARILEHRLTGSAGQPDAIEKTIDTLWDKVYVQGDRDAPDSYCIFPRVWDGGSQVNADTADWPIYNASLITPMVKWYEMTGSSRALDLARWMTNSILRDGEIAEDGSWQGWFHPFVHAGIAMLEYARVTKDEVLCRRMRGFYESGRSQGTSHGVFPEQPTGLWVSKIGNEGCCTVDMCNLAVALSRAGLGDYWDDVDRYLRNQLTEAQMKRTDFLERIPKSNIVHIPIRTELQEAEIKDFTRYIGSLSGWAAPNDYASAAHLWMQQCCTGNIGRAIYAGFESIVTREDNFHNINLLINRSTKELDIDSYLPWEGKVVVSVKHPVKLAVRMPHYVALQDVVTKLNGMAINRSLAWNGRYVQFSCKAGDTIELLFEVPEYTQTFAWPGRPELVLKHSITDENSGGGMDNPRTVHEANKNPELVKELLEPVEYKITYRGNTVVDIEPDGSIYPIYERDHMRLGKAPISRYERFVPTEDLVNWP